MNKQQVVVIVDPYSSGRYLVQELQQQQWPIVGIQSSFDLADFWLAQYDESLFVKTVRHSTLEQTLLELQEFNVAAVLPGSEPGVLLAEDLQDSLKLPGNGAATKAWRRDKHPMQERLREVGLRAIHQLYSDKVEDILEWQGRWGKWPIIIKPAMSGGADGVYWCHGPDDVRLAYDEQCGKMNVNGVVNAQLLAQEFLDGTEYIVDCVSHEGRHVVSAVWEYSQVRDSQTKGISKDYARLIEANTPTAKTIIEYVFKCLTALDIKYGASHSEVIITEDGPCLVETGARMHGLKGPKMAEYGTGIGTHELVIDVAVNNARIFNELHARSDHYVVKKWVFETLLRSNKRGVLLESLDVPEIRALPSMLDFFPNVHPGDELQITLDLATSPGVILQCHPRLDVCWEDLERIRQLEATTLYKVADPKVQAATKLKPKQGCLSLLGAALCCFCARGSGHAVAKRTSMPSPSPSVMSPVHGSNVPRRRSATKDLDPSTDLENEIVMLG
jgi:biotin carboxylase